MPRGSGTLLTALLALFAVVATACGDASGNDAGGGAGGGAGGDIERLNGDWRLVSGTGPGTITLCRS